MRLPLLFSSACLVLALTGCGMGDSASSISGDGVAINGKVYGGQAPIAGAHVYLLYANQNGYNSPSSSLLNAIATGNSDSLGAYVLTNAQGGFSITGDYTCTAGQQVYLYTLGGNAGSGPNSAASEMAVLGNCPGATGFAPTIPFLQVNEVTTVAAAYALAGFANDSTHVASGTSALAKTGLTNAFSNAANLANIGTGVALTKTPNGNGTVPAATINTIADIIASCINSTGPSSTQCTTLFSAARADGTTGFLATDTASAAINIAHHPAANLPTLVGLVTAASPFQPTVSSPNDLSIGIAFSGAGLSQPYTVAIDAAGSVWTANGAGLGGLSKFSALGVPLSGANTAFTGGGVGAPNAVALDPSGNAWAVNGIGLIAKFSNAGVPLSPSGGYNAPGAGTQLGLAIDASSNVWITNFNNPSGVDEISPSGVPVPGSGSQPYTAGGINFPLGVAIAGDNSVWVGNDVGQSLTHLSTLGVPYSGSPFIGGGLCNPHGVAIDANGAVWVANRCSDSTSKFTSTGVAISTSIGYNGGGMSNPTSIAIDGANNVWVGNNGNNSVTNLNNSGNVISGIAGYSSGSMNAPQGIAIDPSGNVWVANSNGNTLTELIGTAVPAVQPLSAAVATNSLGAKP